jgi:uncharacterized protein with von Willebrand factor type A (vWA) domain
VIVNDDLIVHLARFAGALRGRGIDVAIGDEVDAARALTLLDLFDRAEVQRALQIALKIRPSDRAAFETLFRWFWTLAQCDSQILEPVDRRFAGGAVPRSGATGGSSNLTDRERRQAAVTRGTSSSGVSPSRNAPTATLRTWSICSDASHHAGLQGRAAG